MERYLPINHPWIDSQRAPIYRVNFPATTSDDSLRGYCRAVEKWSGQVRYPIAWVMDLSRVTSVSAQQRAAFAKYMAAMRKFDEQYTRASALILPSTLLRGIATAVFWLYEPTFPHRSFADHDEALSWAREALGDMPARPSLRPS
jgi:hypothetical protein